MGFHAVLQLDVRDLARGDLRANPGLAESELGFPNQR